MPIYEIEGRVPEFEDRESNFIAPDAVVIGECRIGRDVSIWFGSVLRGDNDPISIGARTSIQEHVVMHTSERAPLSVGEGCTIGHKAMLHGCTIGDYSLIGMGAIVLDGAKIGRNSVVGAGAVVTEGKEFPDNSLILGQPAKLVRSLDAGEEKRLRLAADHYAEKCRIYRQGLKAVG